MRSAGMPVTGATRSGDQSRAACRRRPDAVEVLGESAEPTRSSSNRVCTTASSSAASVPGVMGSHSSALAAVAVRTGSMTTTVPTPR